MLNKQAELIEQWLEAQREVAEQALEILNSIPGIQIEPCFDQAYALIHSRRADHYGGKGLLFEDTEALGRAMVRYARMLVSPYRAQCDYLAAKAKLSEFDYEPPLPASARARHRMLRMKHLASAGVMKRREWRIKQTRAAMAAASICLGVGDESCIEIHDEGPSEQAASANHHHQLRFRPRF